jgi:Glycosyl transferase family 90
MDAAGGAVLSQPQSRHRSSQQAICGRRASLARAGISSVLPVLFFTAMLAMLAFLFSLQLDLSETSTSHFRLNLAMRTATSSNHNHEYAQSTEAPPASAAIFPPDLSQISKRLINGTKASPPSDLPSVSSLSIPRYPVWNNNLSEVPGINLQYQVIHFAEMALQGYASTSSRKWSSFNFARILYVVDKTGVHVSRTLRDQTWGKQPQHRTQPSEPIMFVAHTILLGKDTTKYNLTSRQERWPLLLKAVVNGAGMPLLIWHGDHKRCPPNWYVFYNRTARGIPMEELGHSRNREGLSNSIHDEHFRSMLYTTTTAVLSRNLSFPTNQSLLDYYQGLLPFRRVPIFTTCAPVGCRHALPLPTYKTISDARRTPQDWEDVFASYQLTYPWSEKLAQVVWRGALSGDHSHEHHHPRWTLGKMVAKYETTGVFDVGLVSIPARHDHLHLNLSEVGGLKQPMRPMESFMKYQAILDIDGVSWSSRFGKLLCYNSVVLKVDPQYVDYFHFRDLQPYVHYVPVRYDLSDLLSQTLWALDPSNMNAVRKIIQNANDWCKHRMVWASIAIDYLDVWERYASFLEAADPQWASTTPQGTQERWTWAEAKKLIFASPGSGNHSSAGDESRPLSFNMIKLQYDQARRL